MPKSVFKLFLPKFYLHPYTKGFFPLREMNLSRRGKRPWITSVLNNKTCAFSYHVSSFQPDLNLCFLPIRMYGYNPLTRICELTVQTVNYFFRVHDFMAKFAFDTCAIKHFTLFQNFYLTPFKINVPALVSYTAKCIWDKNYH